MTGDEGRMTDIEARMLNFGKPWPATVTKAFQSFSA